MKKLLPLMLLMALFVSGFMQAQNNYFALYPNAVDVTSGTEATSSISGAPTSSHEVPNAVFDENGDVVFYFVGRSMYDGGGTFRGNLPVLTGYGQGVQTELAIVPVDGECLKYHVIYGTHGGSGAAYMNVIVDASSTPTIEPLGIGYSPLGTAPTLGGGIAVSQKDEYGDRDLYILHYDVLKHCTISGDNISWPTTLISSNTGTRNANEMDLSEDGTMLAWGDSRDPILCVYDIAADQLDEYDLIDGSMVVGLEFLPGSNKELYISLLDHGTVHYEIDDPFTSLVTSLAEKTQLETAANGKVYGVNDSGKLFSIDPANSHAYSATTISVYSNDIYSNFNAGFYMMNDQIDGENYDYFNGVSPVSFSATVNAEAFQGTYSGTWIEVYNCISIPMVSTISSEEYKIELYQSDATGAQLSSIYSSGWVSGTPSSPLDLRYLSGTNGDWLSNHTGYFILKVTLSNDCSADVTETAFICVNAAPTAATVDLQINKANNNGVPVVVDQTLPGVSLGLYSGSYNISNSSGDIEYYEVTVEEVDCSTGAVIETIYPATEIALTQSIGQLTALALNQLNVPANVAYSWAGGQGFFAQKGYNMCLRLTVGVGNVCGETSDWSYVKLDCFCKQGMTAQSNGEFEVAPYPNPVKNQVNFPISSQSLVIKDISGDIVAIDAQQGNGVTTVNAEGLASGIYFYEIEVDGQRYNGKFVKQ